jgi:hypothetical protein
MPRYYVNDNAQSNGDHEVHKYGCVWLSKVKSKTYLGTHQNCYTAVQKAKQIYSNSNGCATCSSACHTS